MKGCYILLGLMFFISCISESGTSGQGQNSGTAVKIIGSITRISNEIDSLLPADARIEVLADGHEWTEGPLWIERENLLLFSDIPRNAVYSWKEGIGVSEFLNPSGYTGELERGGEPGANGLLLDSQGRLVLCQHGDRQIGRLISEWNQPEPQFETIVNTFNGKRFNSPNDAVYNTAGDLYFTDPPYGLEGNINDPAKELDFQGVFLVKKGESKAQLLVDSLTRPNGIAFSPGGNTLYIANSDPQKACWIAYDVDDAGLSNGRIFYDATDRVGEEKGLPDGLKVHSSGVVFATGPGGIWIFSPEGKVLGKIKTGEATANCTFDTNEKNLYITADMYLLRVRMK